jgi:hypothetical protein
MMILHEVQMTNSMHPRGQFVILDWMEFAAILKAIK